MSSDSVDSVITDPPGGISFMGKVWDSDKGGRDYWIIWMAQVAAECLRVIKPGGHALVWALPRTSHWTATAWENAGWEVRDRIAHLFGSGFPKSANHLKPACEDWWLLRKPLIGSVADNVLAHGTGAINIDDCRIGATDAPEGRKRHGGGRAFADGESGFKQDAITTSPAGRWPANVIHDGSDEVMEAFAAFGERPSGAWDGNRNKPKTKNTYGTFDLLNERGKIGDTGTAARFFYCAKSSKSERNGSKHPTVKPVSLMRYLCKLVTPPNGIILRLVAGFCRRLNSAASRLGPEISADATESGKARFFGGLEWRKLNAGRRSRRSWSSRSSSNLSCRISPSVAAVRHRS